MLFFSTKLEMKVLHIAPTCKDIHTPGGSLNVAHLESDNFESSYNNSAKPQEREEIATFFMMVSRMMEKRAAVCLPPH